MNPTLAATAQARKWALYHDFDELKCEVIREAIKARAITEGEVICGDIKQLTANDVRGFMRCHFFAGGGFWDLALTLAGWGDRPVWTGSCPCPSFSAAGKGGGFDDPRHLWPDWFELIRECRPPVLFGEQADDAIGYGWLDLVQANMEAETYAVGAVVFGAHSVGAPHIRQRLYFCADTASRGHDGRRTGEESGRGTQARREPERSRDAGLSPNTDGGQPSDGDLQRSGEHGLFEQDSGTGESADPGLSSGHAELQHESGSESRRGETAADGSGVGARISTVCGSDAEHLGHNSPRGLAAVSDRDQPHQRIPDGDCAIINRQHPLGARLQGHLGDVREWRGPGWLDPQQARSIAETGATRGFWADCDWWYGRDGKYRPIGPGLQPLAHGSPARVGRLRMYGDAIVVSQAAEFIKAYKESRGR